MKVFRNTIFHLLSLPVLLLIFWAAMLLAQRPCVGIFWDYSSGIVYQVDQLHPLPERIQKGDRVLSGDGLDPIEIYKLNGKSIGDQIVLQIERQGQTFNVPIMLIAPSFWLAFERMIPLVIAFAFLLAGNLVFAYHRSGNLSHLFFAICLGFAVSLSSGSLSAFGPTWTRLLFQVGLLWTVAFTVTLHLFFPTRIHNRLVKSSGLLLIGGSLLLALTYGVGNIVHSDLLDPPIFRWLPLVLLGLDMVFVVMTLAWSYRKSQTAIERHQAGAIVFSGLIGILPLFTFSLLPQLINGYPIISYNVSFLSLLFMPIGYGYAILRYRMLGTEKIIHRGATNALIALSLGSVFSIWYALSTRLVSPEIGHSPFWLLGTTVSMAILTNKLNRTFLNFANRVLYGGWYDYRSVVDSVSLSLNATDIDNVSIGTTLCQVIGKSMRLEYANLLLPNQTAFTYLDQQAVQIRRFDTTPWPALLERMEALDARNRMFISWRKGLEDNLGVNTLEVDRPIQYLVPLRGKGKQVLGILLLGQKCDGEGLGDSDLEILKVVVHQAQVTLENVRLLDEVQQHVNMISRLHMQVIRAREGERKRLARDLHDLIIQTLIGINFKLHEMTFELRNIKEDDLISRQTEIRRAIADLRQICTDLRPANLEVSGLVAAIQSKAAEIEKNASFQILTLIEGNDEQEISEESKLCIYRFVQESLLNVQKHAQANRVELWVQVTSETVTVSIVDDGVGFIVPENLDHLTQEKHFGLIGLKEQVESVKGTMQVKSKPGEGCALSAQVPV